MTEPRPSTAEAGKNDTPVQQTDCRRYKAYCAYCSAIDTQTSIPCPGHDSNLHSTTGRQHIMIMDTQAAASRSAAAAARSAPPMSFPPGLPYLPTDTRHSSMSLSRPPSLGRLNTHDSASISSQRTRPALPALPHGFSGRPAYNAHTPPSGRADASDRAARQSTSSYGTDYRKSYDRSLRTSTGSMKDGQEPFSLGNFVFEGTDVPPLPALPPNTYYAPPPPNTYYALPVPRSSHSQPRQAPVPPQRFNPDRDVEKQSSNDKSDDTDADDGQDTSQGSPEPEQQGQAQEKDQEEENPNLVDWDGPDDPQNPTNFSFTRKSVVTCMFGLMTFAVTFASSVFSTATEPTSRLFGVSTEVMTLGTSLFVLGFAFGPIVWGPLSELYGRKPPLFFGYLVFAIFQIPVAVAQNLETIFLCRFLGGFFGSAPLAILGGALADIWDPVERGVALCVFAGATFIGACPAAALSLQDPIYVEADHCRSRGRTHHWVCYAPSACFIANESNSGFVTQSYLGWRWTAVSTPILLYRNPIRRLLPYTSISSPFVRPSPIHPSLTFARINFPYALP